MSSDVTQYNVFIASPGDVGRERDLACDVIDSINSRIGKAQGFHLDAVRWQTHVQMDAGRTQASINPLVRECDVFVGILWARFGTPSGEEESGTAEEFKEALKERAENGDRPTMLVFFSERAVDRTKLRDEEVRRQLEKVDVFRDDYERNKGLAVSYANDEEFKEALRDHLSQWCATKVADAQPGRSEPRPATTEDLVQQRQRFLASEVAANKYLEMTAFETRVRVPVALDEVMVPVRARVGVAQDGAMAVGHPAKRGGAAARRLAHADDVIEFGDAWRRARDEHVPTIVVLGAPGSGKTTLLRSLLLRCASDPNLLELADDSVPLLLPLREIQTDESLSAAAARILRLEDIHLAADFAERFLRDGRALVLLDGLDEIASASQRGEVSRWIERQRHIYPACPFVVTARFAGYRAEARLEIATFELALERFRKDEIRSFLRRWYETVERTIHGGERATQFAEELADELIERVLSTPEIYNLATNPLMLQIIALVHRDRGALPDRRVELYDECINVLLERWDKARGIAVPISAREARRVLQPVAYWMHQVPDRRYATQEELEPLIEKELTRLPSRTLDAPEFLTRVRDRSGLFVGHGSDEYGFPHLSFQEYLAACEVRRLGDYETLAVQYDESWWREVTRLLMGLDNPSSFTPFMRAVIARGGLIGHNDFTSECIRDAFEPEAAPFVDALARVLEGRREDASGVHYHLLLAMRELRPEILRIADCEPIRSVSGWAVGDIAGSLARELLEYLGEEVAADRDRATGLPLTRTNSIDGSELILVPAGAFQAGSEYDRRDNPPRALELESFYLTRYAVTNEQYAKFLAANSDAAKPEYWDVERFNQPRQPVVGIGWSEAQRYCEWAGLRLPSEWEWEKAARGMDGRLFPWGGEEPDETRANYSGDQPTPVGSYGNGAGPYGHLDLAGNVFEWTSSLYQEDSEWRTLRGGAFISEAEYLRASIRYDYRPAPRLYYVGFRCAQDP